VLKVVDAGNASEVGRQAAAIAAMAIVRASRANSRVNVLLAAAPSQAPALAALAALDVHERVTYFHMDEYLGLPEGAPQSFGSWLRREFLERLPEGTDTRFVPIDTTLAPQDAVDTYAAALPRGDFDLVLCGIGVNGHLAFNDPGTDLDDEQPVRRVRLAEASRRQQVNDGLFEALQDVPEYALTLTVPRIMAARTIVCSVLGAQKARAVRETLRQRRTSRVPATVLNEHPDATIVADREALRDVHD